MFAALFQSVSLTPPDDGKLLNWILGLVVAALVVMFTLRERATAKIERTCEGEKTKLETRLEAAQETIRKLGEKLDDAKDARANDQKRMARLLLRQRRNIAAPEPWESDADEFDIPTGVYEAMSVVGVAERPERLDPKTERKLRDFDPYHETTPPEALPRKRSPSRPDR